MIASYSSSFGNFYYEPSYIVVKKEIFSSTLKNALAYYNAGVPSCKLTSCRICSSLKFS
jgi:hypothetical protein